MNVAEFVIARLNYKGVDTVFSVTGGGAMFINNACANTPGLKTYYLHHEQACAMAAEGYARVANKPAIVNVTTGPGAINSLNGVFGAFTDSIPMIVVAGQVKTSTISDLQGLKNTRQLGDQEVRSIEMVRSICKKTYLIDSSDLIAETIDEAYSAAVSGRPGPVWLEIPIDIQSMQIELDPSKTNKLEKSFNSESKKEDLNTVIELLSKSKRPVILSGTGIKLSQTKEQLIKFAELISVPVLTAWSHDSFPNEHALYFGRPGTIGTRAGNLIFQNSDLVIVLGSRLNIRQTGYNFQGFAKNSRIIWVDIDENEFKKPHIKYELAIKQDLKFFLPELIEKIIKRKNRFEYESWLNWCLKIKKFYTPKIEDYNFTGNKINPYHFMFKLFSHIPKKSIIVCGNASACIIPFQVGNLKNEQQMFSNSGSASMGYDLPAAIGAAIADPESTVICIAGDGSIMMNLQELETIKRLQLNIKIFLLSNEGYLSIKQTQNNFFNKKFGADSESGLDFPDFNKVFSAFGIKNHFFQKPDDDFENIRIDIGSKYPVGIVVSVDPSQEFEPRIKTKRVENKMITPELDEMHPPIDTKVLNELRLEALSI